MTQYPYIKIHFNGTVYVLLVNGEKYAVVNTVEVLSDCINEAIKDYLDNRKETT